MQAYQIEIDERQRCILYTALSKLNAQESTEGINELFQMFGELKQIEEENPCVLHCFCR